MNLTSNNHHIPHLAIRNLIEVGVVVGVFFLAIGCMAYFLNRRTGDDGNHQRDYEYCSCFSAIGRWCKRTILLGRNNNDDDDESYIGDEESNRPAPHVFDTLNELVFFLAPGDNDGATGVLATTPIKRRSRNSNSGGDGNSDNDDDNDNDENRLPTATTMDQIFPDLLGTKPAGNGTSGGGLLDGGVETGRTNDATTNGDTSNDGGLRERLL